MQATLERLLYVTLLLVFIGIGLGVYVIYTQNSQRAQQIKSQSNTIVELRKAVDEIKANSKENTSLLVQQNQHIECVIDLLVQGDTSNIEGCPAVPTVPQGIETLDVPQSQPTFSPSPQPSQTPSQPTVQPKGNGKANQNSLLNQIKKLTGIK